MGLPSNFPCHAGGGDLRDAHDQWKDHRCRDREPRRGGLAGAQGNALGNVANHRNVTFGWFSPWGPRKIPSNPARNPGRRPGLWLGRPYRAWGGGRRTANGVFGGCAAKAIRCFPISAVVRSGDPRYRSRHYNGFGKTTDSIGVATPVAAVIDITGASTRFSSPPPGATHRASTTTRPPGSARRPPR